MVLKNGAADVPQVLGGQGAGQGLPAGVAVQGEEGGHLAGISPRPAQQVLPPGEGAGLAGMVLRRQPLLPEGGASGQLLGPLPLLIRGERAGAGGVRGGGMCVKAHPARVTRRAGGQRQGELRPVAIPLGRKGPQAGQHVDAAQPQLRLGAAILPGGEDGNGVEKAVVEQLHLNAGAGGGPALRQRPEGDGAGLGVPGGLVIPVHPAVPAQRFAVEGGGAGPKQAAVHQHRPGGGGVEPAPV